MENLFTIEGTTLVDCDSSAEGHIVVPSGVKTIKDSAFYGCKKLKSVEISSGVEVIECQAFSECEKLEKVIIPASVRFISYSVFSGCPNLLELEIEQGNRYYCYEDGFLLSKDKMLLHTCIAHKSGSVTIPNYVTNIGSDAFSDCSEITEINIPASVFEINDLAFYECSSLRSLDIPWSVDFIGYAAVNACSRLEKLSLYNDVETNDLALLADCPALKELHLGFRELSLEDEDVEINENIFNEMPKENCTLYLPKEAKERFEKHPLLDGFKRIVAEDRK